MNGVVGVPAGGVRNRQVPTDDRFPVKQSLLEQVDGEFVWREHALQATLPNYTTQYLVTQKAELRA